MDFRKFKPAGPQECGRSSFQQLNIQFGMDLSGKIDILLVQKALDPMEHSVHFVKSPLDGVPVYSRQTGIDHCCGAS